MIKKTYAARGMIDWQMAINVKGAIIKIPFTGGSMGSNGVIPAKFTTDNPVIQQLLEKSKVFKTHRIVLYSVEKPKKESDQKTGNEKGDSKSTGN